MTKLPPIPEHPPPLLAAWQEARAAADTQLKIAAQLSRRGLQILQTGGDDLLAANLIGRGAEIEQRTREHILRLERNKPK